jgi:glyoxylase-like metal-dependent hydrolase (beta-lactamase superfamily II)
MARLPHLIEVVPGLHILEGESDGRFPRSHSIVIRGATDVLIDAGCGLDRLAELTAVWRPDLLIVSHSHPDHCAGAWMLEDTRILSPVERSDAFWRLESQSVRFAGTEAASMWIRFVTEHMGIRDFDADGHFENRTVFDFGSISLECHHAPGHTEDHYIFFEPHHGLAITFDIDLTSFGPWYGHVESDIDAFLRSIQLVIDLEPKMLLSSHKGLVTDDIEGRLRRFAAVVDDRDRRILALLNRPKTISDLVDASPIYGGYPYAEIPLRYWEGQMIRKHLRRMERDDAIEVQGGQSQTTERSAEDAVPYSRKRL